MESAKAGQESAPPMTEEVAALEGLFQTGLLPLLTLCPTTALSESSAGAEFTTDDSPTTGGGEREEEGAADLFQAGLLPVLTLCPTAALSESSTGAEVTTDESTTIGGGEREEEGGAVAATIWFQGEETTGLGESLGEEAPIVIVFVLG